MVSNSKRQPTRPTTLMIVAAMTAWLIVGGVAPAEVPESMLSDKEELARNSVMAVREADWRIGAVVYQVLVDRFVPSLNLDAKAHLYDAPRRLRDWTQKPTRGKFLQDVKLWSHELDFWGGDLASLMTKLDHVESLGVDALYLNPIHEALTNHKYDAHDYSVVSAEYGTREDVVQLADDLHQRGMKLVLDGVFNHMGRKSPKFQDALVNPDSPTRDWFDFDDRFDGGYRAWMNVANLPALRLDNSAVQGHIFTEQDSVVRGFLRDGVDGWRLDVAAEMGTAFLRGLTLAAHETKPDSLVVGENWTYPGAWNSSLDGVMNFHYWQIFTQLVQNKIGGAHAGRMFAQAVEDSGLEFLLRSWIILDNHDLPRLKSQLKQPWQQRMAQVLQFTLPGCPCIYYGVEVGMTGGDDPAQRGPMRWEMLRESNADLQWMKKLTKIRSSSRALRIGDFQVCESDKLLAYMRTTDRVDETMLVVVNPSAKKVEEWIQMPDARILSMTALRDQLSDAKVTTSCGLARVEIPARTAWVLKLDVGLDREAGPYRYAR